MMTKPITAVQFKNIWNQLGVHGVAANESRGSVGKTAAMKKTPRQAASSVTAVGEKAARPNQVTTGKYQYVPVMTSLYDVMGMTSVDDVIGF